MATRTIGREQPTPEEIAREAKKKQRNEDYNLVRPDPASQQDVVKGVARAIVEAKGVHPGAKRQILDAVNTRLERDSTKGKAGPTVQIYDKTAPAKSKALEPGIPIVDRNVERTR